MKYVCGYLFWRFEDGREFCQINMINPKCKHEHDALVFNSNVFNSNSFPRTIVEWNNIPDTAIQETGSSFCTQLN